MSKKPNRHFSKEKANMENETILIIRKIKIKIK